jgi:outer membrane receptor protein involved in Fe transport
MSLNPVIRFVAGWKPIPRVSYIGCLLAIYLFTITAYSQDTNENGSERRGNLVSYPSSYFDRYHPLTALDMVRQVPGFVLQENDESIRGMGSALGNFLINDRRPSTKQDQPLEILARIPVELVERIEIIRGQVRDIDMQGQSSLINIVLIEDSRAVVQWDAYIRQTFEHGGITPKASFSLSDKWHDIEYNFGLGYRQSNVGYNGSEDIDDKVGDLTEIRVLNRETDNKFYSGNLNASRWLGETFAQLNTKFMYEDHVFFTSSRRFPQPPGSSSRYITFDKDYKKSFFEMGFDLERELYTDFTGKMIFLFYRGFEDGIEIQRSVDGSNIQTLQRSADTYNTEIEGITRLELDWAGIPGHAIQGNAEAVMNVFKGKLFQTNDTGNGPVPVAVPGANSRVREIRWDFLLMDTWSSGRLNIDMGLGGERSTVMQTGDVTNERSFFFIKPQWVMTYTPEQGRQLRFRLGREVAQLDLGDFISATVLEDDDLAMGNPEIKPDSSWVSELSYERRFTRNSVAKLTVFHHWIADVFDLVPITDTFEAPGNIGNGRRWGIELESTLPLQWLGLIGARLKLKARWQDSTVTDPVTREARVISAVRNSGSDAFFNVENEYAFNINFRHDFEAARFAWGFILQDRAAQYHYKVNELQVENETVEINTFIETTHWLGIKIRIDLENVTDYNELRERTVYMGLRNLTAMDVVESRNIGGGPRAFLTFSGNF